MSACLQGSVSDLYEYDNTYGIIRAYRQRDWILTRARQPRLTRVSDDSRKRGNQGGRVSVVWWSDHPSMQDVRKERRSSIKISRKYTFSNPSDKHFLAAFYHWHAQQIRLSFPLATPPTCHLCSWILLTWVTPASHAWTNEPILLARTSSSLCPWAALKLMWLRHSEKLKLFFPTGICDLTHSIVWND